MSYFKDVSLLQIELKTWVAFVTLVEVAVRVKCHLETSQNVNKISLTMEKRSMFKSIFNLGSINTIEKCSLGKYLTSL